MNIVGKVGGIKFRLYNILNPAREIIERIDCSKTSESYTAGMGNIATICKLLGCQLDDLMEYVDEEENT